MCSKQLYEWLFYQDHDFLCWGWEGVERREDPHSADPACEPCLTQGVVLSQNFAAHRRLQKLISIHVPLSNTQHYFALH